MRHWQFEIDLLARQYIRSLLFLLLVCMLYACMSLWLCELFRLVPAIAALQESRTSRSGHAGKNGCRWDETNVTCVCLPEVFKF